MCIYHKLFYKYFIRVVHTSQMKLYNFYGLYIIWTFYWWKILCVKYFKLQNAFKLFLWIRICNVSMASSPDIKEESTKEEEEEGTNKRKCSVKTLNMTIYCLLGNLIYRTDSIDTALDKLFHAFRLISQPLCHIIPGPLLMLYWLMKYPLLSPV